MTAPDIFLSYSREDQATARRFADSLEALGFTVWWDAALRTGEFFDQVIEKALNEAKAVVVLWSKRSVDSRWVRAEATMAARNKTLAPVIIEACQRPIIFELTHTADLAHWTGDAQDPSWRNFVADVRRLVEDGVPRTVAVPVETRSHSVTAAVPWYRQRSLKGVIVALPVLIAAALFFLFVRTPALHSGTSASADDRTAASGVSLAVLPFVDMSPQHDQEYFSDGLSEELLNQLAQIMDLQVAGRTSSFSFKGRNEDLRVIGQELGVNHLLEGSVRKAGDSLRITAQLINAATGTHMWSHTYDRKLDNVFSVQEDIAKDVASALSIKLDVGEMSRGMGGTDNLDAYDKYLRARALYYQGGLDAFQQSVEFYHEAIALDPNFARAWYGLYTTLQQVQIFGKADAAGAEMKQISKRLITLTPDAWWTLQVRSAQAVLEHNWSEAQTTGAAALAAAPSAENIALAYGVLLHELGRIQEGMPYFLRAHQTDPLSLTVSFSLQIALDAAGRPDEAQAEYVRSKDLAGDHWATNSVALTRLLARGNSDPAAVRTQFLLANPAAGSAPGFEFDKQAILADVRREIADPAFRLGTAMVQHAASADLLGDKELALAGFQRGFVELQSPGFLTFWQVNHTGLRADPRFKQLVRELKFADYFRTSGMWNDFCHPVGKEDFACQ